MILVGWLLACSSPEAAYTFPAPELAMPPLRGPGAPAVAFSEEQLWEGCATLTGSPEDQAHHNLLMPYRGHLVMPWIPEWGNGGVSLFDLSDPCAPVKVGEAAELTLRESHALGFVHLPADDPHAGDWLALTGMLGVQIWDLSDETSPKMASYLELDGVFYPDSYARPVLSVFWQYPWLYVAGADNGLYVVDATDPYAPVAVSTYTFSPVLRAGGVFVLGNQMLVSSAEGTESAQLDVSDPTAIQPIPGGIFTTANAAGEPQETYHGNLYGPYAFYANKDQQAGMLVYDVSVPGQPTFVSEAPSDGNGGYVFYHEGFAFVGESSVARVYDVRDVTAPVLHGEAHLVGDLDTVTPYGNVALLSVDDDSEDDVATIVVPWATEPDTTPPEVWRVDPPDGATNVPVTARIGVGFNEIIEPSSVFAGSIRLYAEDGTAVPGWGSGQDGIASYSPKEPLAAGTTYTIEVVAGGVRDASLNAVAEAVRASFTTAGP
jgi:hypothetical protein